ncbi:hypothetical protein DLAC_05487 [Tieghemostelium lacteum]|uniref:Uncharacterized protein n=1 Tax=Tieghemostelium lacteum TaxID=361077 RepID=A0A151ZG02_TIELA|nr:hypothetical protein DLAC_05487 [Tieghemostelium lacteum]|eukprot:KYQ92896.1 hypothetical protein DLAC_05487 [Tieghemostelium lacteum]
MKFVSKLILSALLLNAIVNAKNCFENDQGFSSIVGLVGYNVFPYDGSPSTLSFTESSGLAVDYVGQRMWTAYEIYEGGQVLKGEMYCYGSNQTQYIVSNGSCTQMPLTYAIPNGFPKNYSIIGDTKLGKFKVNVVEIPGVQITSEALVDLEKCAVVSINIQNNDENNAGFGIANYFDFKNSFSPSDFNLPSECYQPETLGFKLFKHSKQTKPRLPITPKVLF